METQKPIKFNYHVGSVRKKYINRKPVYFYHCFNCHDINRVDSDDWDFTCCECGNSFILMEV